LNRENVKTGRVASVLRPSLVTLQRFNALTL